MASDIGSRSGTGTGNPIGRTAIVALLATMAALVIFYWPRSTLLDRFELYAIDWRFQTRGPIAPHPDIVIVDVDELSLQRYGRWPWPRALLGRVVERLAAAGARAIAMDVFVVEPSPGDQVSDAALARATRRAGMVFYAAYGVSAPQGSALSTVTTWPEARKVAGRGLDAVAGLPEFAGFRGPLPELAQAARGVGYTDVVDSGDGVYRLALPVAVCEGVLCPSLAVAVAAATHGIEPDAVTVRLGREVRVGDLPPIPIDRGGRTGINFVGAGGTFPYVSASSVLTEDAARLRDRFSGKYVLVSVSAAGQYDLRATPFSSVMNGVEIQATILDNILQGRFLRALPPELCGALIIVATLLTAVAFCLLRTGHAVAFALAELWGIGAVSEALFVRAQVIAPVFAPAAGVGIALVALLTQRLLIEEERRRRVRQMLTHFVPPDVAAELERADPDEVRAGKRRAVTVLFADLRHFTGALERMAPEDAVGLLNRWFTLMHEVIWEYEGTLDKYVGDELMALFNAPARQEDHVLRAVRCAIAMQRQMRTLRSEWEFYGMPDLEAGIGIATGEAVVGCVGSLGRLQYTAIGGTVNLAARLEEVAKRLGADIVISDAVYEQVKDQVDAQALEPMLLQGFERPVRAYSVMIT